MIGIGSPTFCLHPFDEMVEAISKEFRLWELLSEGENRLELLRDKVKESRDSYDIEFQVHAPLSDVNVGSVHEPMRSAAVGEIKKTIALCRELDIGLITVHPGFVQGIAFLDKTMALKRTKESIKELASFARDRAVDVALENLPGNINATCTQARELVEVADYAEVGICFDMGHANTSGQLREMLELVGRFRNVHLHNNEGQWDQHNIVDEGSADLRLVLEVLKRSYRGNMVVEATDLASGIESRKRLQKMLE